MTTKAHTLLEALTRNKEVDKLIQEENRRHTAEITPLEKEKVELDEFIKKAKEPGNLKTVVGESHIKAADANNTRVMTKIVKEAKHVIDSGDFPKLLENNQDISYWYNSGFKDGRIRHMERGMGESNAYPLGVIRFSDDLYNGDTKLTDDIILALLSYLDKLEYDLAHLDEGLLDSDSIIKSKKSGKEYPVVKNVDGGYDCVKSFIPYTDVPDDTTKLNNWLIKAYTIKEKG